MCLNFECEIKRAKEIPLSCFIKTLCAYMPQNDVFKAINVFGTSKKKLTFYFVFVITQLNS